MVVRKLSLAEWFLHYQLMGIQNHHSHNPFFLEIDLTKLDRVFGGEKKIPLTALAIKAAALLRESIPEAHRVLVPSLFGPRMIEFSEAKVNVPVVLEKQGQLYLSAIIVENALDKSLSEIVTELRAAKKFDKKRYPLSHFVSSKSNNFLNRWILRTLYFFAYRTTGLYKKRGGGVSVSAVSTSQVAGRNIIGIPKGPTALSFAMTGLDYSENGRPIVHVGVGYNHAALLAIDAGRAMALYSDILSGKNAALFQRLIEKEEVVKRAVTSKDNPKAPEETLRFYSDKLDETWE